MILEAFLILLAAVLGYAWLLYPLLLVFILPSRRPTATNAPAGPPSVAVLFSAFNEERHIRPRLENLLSLRPPSGPFEIHVGLDGCTDATADIARALADAHERVHVHRFSERRGKMAVIKDLVGRTGADVLVMTDANTLFHDDALERMLSHLANPGIGGVCGRLALVGAKDERVYWTGENLLKRKESALDSCLGANGAIYAVRRELFWQDIPANTIVDDFVIGMKVREQGFRMVYEPAAVAEEELPDTGTEWGRRVRIGAGDYQALHLCRACLLPRYGRFAWMFLSHKVLRWFTPHLLLLIVLTSGLLVVRRFPAPPGPACGWLMAGLALFVVLGAIGRLARRGCLARVGALGIPRQCDHFLTMQAALFVGFLRFCRRRDLAGHWIRTPR